MVTRWAVEQEVVGSNPTHGGNLISVVRSLSGFTQTQFGKMSIAFSGRGPAHRNLDIKYEHISFADWL